MTKLAKRKHYAAIEKHKRAAKIEQAMNDSNLRVKRAGIK
jgi:hypothetical protein